MQSKKPLRVLVTGGHSRIGKTITTHLAENGLTPTIHYNRGKEAAQAHAFHLQQRFGTQPATVQCDLCDTEDSVRALVQEPSEPWDAVVFNASSFDYDTAEDLNAEVWKSSHAVHYDTPVRLACELVKRNPKMSLVFILDQNVVNLNPDFFSYTLSKMAMHAAIPMLTQCLAPARVNAVCPGMTLPAFGQSEEAFQRVHDSTILQRGNTAEDIANAVLFLLTAPAITGQVMFVDGGQRFTQVPRDGVFLEKPYV